MWSPHCSSITSITLTNVSSPPVLSLAAPWCLNCDWTHPYSVHNPLPSLDSLKSTFSKNSLPANSTQHGVKKWNWVWSKVQTADGFIKPLCNYINVLLFSYEYWFATPLCTARHHNVCKRRSFMVHYSLWLLGRNFRLGHVDKAYFSYLPFYTF